MLSVLKRPRCYGKRKVSLQATQVPTWSFRHRCVSSFTVPLKSNLLLLSSMHLGLSSSAACCHIECIFLCATLYTLKLFYTRLGVLFLFFKFWFWFSTDLMVDQENAAKKGETMQFISNF